MSKPSAYVGKLEDIVRAFDAKDRLSMEQDILHASNLVRAQTHQILATPDHGKSILTVADEALTAHQAAVKEHERQQALAKMRYDAMRRFRRRPDTMTFNDLFNGWTTATGNDKHELFLFLVETLRPGGLPRDGPFVWCSREDRTEIKDTTGEIKVALQSILTPPGVSSFLNLQTPRAVVTGGELRYSLTIIFDKAQQARPEFKALQEGIDAALKEKWPARLPVGLKSPFHDAAEKAGQYEGYKPGDIFISPWSKTQPGCINARKEDIIDFSEFFAGWLVRAKVRPFAYDQGGNKGCSFFLDHVQFLKPGKRLDGRKAASESFPDDGEGEEEMV
jgi:hypothetical protein